MTSAMAALRQRCAGFLGIGITFRMRPGEIKKFPRKNHKKINGKLMTCKKSLVSFFLDFADFGQAVVQDHRMNCCRHKHLLLLPGHGRGPGLVCSLLTTVTMLQVSCRIWCSGASIIRTSICFLSYETPMVVTSSVARTGIRENNQMCSTAPTHYCLVSPASRMV